MPRLPLRPLDAIPIGLGRLLQLIFPIAIIADVPDGVGEILLLHIVVGVVVGLEIALGPLHGMGVGMHVLQVPGHIPGAPGGHVGHGLFNAHTAGV